MPTVAHLIPVYPIFAAHLWDFSPPSSILLVSRAEKVIIRAAGRGGRAKLTGGGHAISPQLPDIQQFEATTLGVLPEEGRLLRHLAGQIETEREKNGRLKGTLNPNVYLTTVNASYCNLLSAGRGIQKLPAPMITALCHIYQQIHSHPYVQELPPKNL